MEIQTFMDETARLFESMERAYDGAAARLGFQCYGCEDNCCRSLFFHHTLVELIWLKSGLAELSVQDQARIRERAEQIRDLQIGAGVERFQSGLRPFCPLNSDGRCLLYSYRPMICRLHGIPYVLRNPSGQVRTGQGCGDFYRQTATEVDENASLDRTPLYMAMADLEKRLRMQAGYNAKIKLTIAEMILEELPPIEIFV